MPLSRLLTIILGISAIVGSIIWLIAAIGGLYSQIAWTSPMLANLLILLIIVLLAVLIGVFYYYFVLEPDKTRGLKSGRRKPRIKVPEQKAQAAAENLKAVRKQVGQIQDRVAKQALLNRSREIQQNLAKGNLRIVVFGTGSAGKTSLVNALIGEIVGSVEATMGTTKIGETYHLKLPGLDREILITDTPGILEAGVAGTEREELARQLATEADLLLFVVDNDLRQSENEPLKALVEIGKRSLLIFNKLDLYAEEDKELILKRLRDRVKGIISHADVIAIAANPQPVQLPSGDIIEPEAEVLPLIKRLVAVLRAEGEDLIADNILLQSQRLGDEARKLLDRQRRRQADKIIDRYQWIGAGVIAVTPLPVVDMLATAAVNAQMVVEIGRVYGCEINSDRGKELAFSLGKTLISLGVVKGAIELLVKALQFNVATYVVGKVIQGITAAYLTRIAGKSFVEYFRQDQDWGDGGIAEVVQRQFQLSRKDEFVKAFIKDAIAKVVKPLTDNSDSEDDLPEDDEDEYEEEELQPIPTNFVPEDDWEKIPTRSKDEW